MNVLVYYFTSSLFEMTIIYELHCLCSVKDQFLSKIDQIEQFFFFFSNFFFLC